jgi:hypothetical protein
MHTNSIIELNNTAYQNLFSPNHFGKKVQISCVVKEMLTAHYRNRFNGVQNGITHFRF